MITNAHTRTNIQEIADGIYRINTPLDIPGGAFSFNQYLALDAEPLLFHTGPRRLFPVVSEAVAHVLPPERLRWISFSHFEADECGSLNDWLALAPAAQALCSTTAAMVSVSDFADREPRGLADGETISTGRRTFRWFDTPHLPHGWETGYIADESTRTLFCGDLFTQPGHGEVALTTGTSSGRAKPSAGKWITTRTRRTPGPSSRSWPRSGPRPWQSCTAAPGAATAPLCSASSRVPWRPDARNPYQGRRAGSG